MFFHPIAAKSYLSVTIPEKMKKCLNIGMALFIALLLFACNEKKPATWVDNSPTSATSERETMTEEATAPEKEEFNFNYTYPDNILHQKDMEFYPIGFSKDGLFAYLSRPCSNGCGCCSHTIRIQNIFTDKIVSELALSENSEHVENHLQNWNAKERSVISLLRSKGVSQIPMEVIPDKEIEFKGHSYEVRVSKSETPNTDSYYIYPTINYNVKVAMDQRGSGTLVTKGQIINGLSFKYIGYILSPYTDQVMLLFESVEGGFENVKESTIIPIGVTFDPKLF